MIPFDELAKRAQDGRSIFVGLVGAGFLGAGVVRQLLKVRGMSPVVVANRTVSKAIDALISGGVERSRIKECNEPGEASRAIAAGSFVATSVLDLPCNVPEIDVVMETTGNVEAGTRITLAAFRQRKHVVAANLEVHATIGPALKRIADEAGVVYSDIDGDQPGVIMQLYEYCRGLGMQPVIAGNCKGVLKRYATPDTQERFAIENGLAAWIATSAADGTKVNIEMAAVANATGMLPARAGMTGVETTLDTLLDDLERHGLFDGAPAIEFTLGIPSGVFVVASTDDEYLQREFRYLKMGDGPNYVFYEPRVVAHFDAPITAANAALYGVAAITPSRGLVTEVATYAKRDLKAGQSLDGIGGFDCYGLVHATEETRAGNMLPVGLSEGAVLRANIAQDQPVTWDDVEVDEDALPVSLWRSQFEPATV